MEAKIKKTLKQGFVLYEQELRRIVNTSKEQLEKINQVKSDILETFFIEFKNGTLIDDISLEEVLQLENFGTGQITYLRGKIFIKGNPLTFIEFSFNDKILGQNKEDPSVSYSIRGTSRDWVFVTSAILEERLVKIKRFGTNVMEIIDAVGGMSSIWIIVIVILCALWLAQPKQPTRWDYPGNPVYSYDLNIPEILTKERNIGNIKEPLDAIIYTEKLYRQRFQKNDSANIAYESERGKWYKTEIEKYNKGFLRSIPNWIIILLIISLPYMIYFIINRFLRNYYPIYNFIWGDYVESFKKKNSSLYIFIVVIVLGIIVSFIGGLLTNIT